MGKAVWHYWLDLAMGLLSALLAISSFLLWVASREDTMRRARCGC
jgi:hypothetical protein